MPVSWPLFHLHWLVNSALVDGILNFQSGSLGGDSELSYATMP